MRMLNKKGSSVILLAFIMMTGIAACGNDDQAEEKTTLTISAAASLTDALQEAGAVFNEMHPEIQLDFNFGGSGALQQQISKSAPVDMFLSASKSDLDVLVDGGQIEAKNSIDLLQNELVLVTPKDDQTVESFDNITDADQIAVGTPESVPAGTYSMQTFDTLGLTDDVDPLLIYAEDVRAVLTYVERGEVNAGLVYKTDALTSDAVEIVDAAPADAHDPIIYPVGLINDSENVEAARTFYDFLQTEDALAIFYDYGYVTE